MQKDGMMSGSYIKGQGGYVPPPFSYNKVIYMIVYSSIRLLAMIFKWLTHNLGKVLEFSMTLRVDVKFLRNLGDVKEL